MLFQSVWRRKVEDFCLGLYKTKSDDIILVFCSVFSTLDKMK